MPDTSPSSSSILQLFPDLPAPSKACNKCREIKPLTEFFPDNRNRDGKQGQCKRCTSAANYARKVAKRPVRKFAPNQPGCVEKQCRRCECVKPRTAFPPHKKNVDGIDSWCRQCHTEYERLLNRTRPRERLYRGARLRAESAGVPFALTLDDIEIPEFCPVLGLPLSQNEGLPGSNSPTVDRIIPALGYVRGNIAVISFRANVLKGDGSLEELEAVVNYLRERVGS